jgi:hypothetical protein
MWDAACIEEMSMAHNILVGKLERTKPLQRPYFC